MKRLLFGFLLVPLWALASDVYVTEVSSPYAIVPIENKIDEPQLHLGELNNFPVMYEFALTSTTSFRAKISQPVVSVGLNPNPLTLLLVKVNDRGRGVTEIARLKPEPDSWSTIKDSTVGSSFWQGEEITASLESGTYRVEVSTPDNAGKYLLNFGPESDYGYFSSLARAWKIQQFLGYSPLRILTSNLVYYPLGILLLGFLLNRTWKYRKMISNAS